MRRKSLLIIFLSVFIDLIGFGIVLPLLPIYTESFGASDLVIGLIIASYSLMQFLFAPAWGRLSDRIGRRPVLLISNFGSAASYVLFAVASLQDTGAALWLLLASRVFAGICGANLSVASAYIADISPPEKRSKSMGLIGMAFGLGFIFGPALGQFALQGFGPAGPGWVAATICALNFGFGYFILGESRRPGSEAAVKRPKLEQWTATLRQPTVGLLVLVYFFATFCFASFESTFPRLLFARSGDAVLYVGYLFTYCGVLSAIIQGGLIGPLVKRLGEAKLIAVSLFAFAVGLVILPYFGHMAWLIFGLGLVAAGSALNRPPTFGLISMHTSADHQGTVLGVTQSAGSLARILAPVAANLLFRHDPATPYLFCAVIAAVAGLVTWLLLCRRPATPHSLEDAPDAIATRTPQ
ncbi:MAG: MFS transporter [Verrucomicrobia bacterium]|nr:MFS transporter [Verrucomicrobiota bacterium]